MKEAIAICRHCCWGQKRGELSDVVEMVEQHVGDHDVDMRVYDPEVENTTGLGKDDERLTALENGRLEFVEETGEFK